MLSDYQKQVDDAVQVLEQPYWSPLSQLARLIEEVGEVSRILNDKYGDKPKKPGEQHELLENELADIIFAIVCIANRENIVLDKPLRDALIKFQIRDKDRFKRKAE